MASQQTTRDAWHC